MTTNTSWRVWIDTGGTFTDCVAVDPDGVVHRAKALSAGALRGRIATSKSETHFVIDASWAAQAPIFVGATVQNANAPCCEPRTIIDATDAGVITLIRTASWSAGDIVEVRTHEPAPILVARLATRTPVGTPLPPMELRLATTRGTNALLEHKTARVAFFVTQGFGDVLQIGDQRRPDPFALCIHKPAPLHEMVIEVPGRLDAQGAEAAPLDIDAALLGARAALAAGCEAAAVALMHSWLNPQHEDRIALALREAGFAHVSVSHVLAPRIKHLVRSQTAVVNAALAPIFTTYLDAIRASAPKAHLCVMTSAGGLKRAESFHPVEGLLSGPAGGVVGAAEAARRAGLVRVLTFDMGGTSTDVAKVDGAPERAIEHAVGDVRVFSSAAAIETVAAGGGSICAMRGGAPVVGPESAGAQPGPACYGAGGPLTITDVNLLLGRLDPSRFETPIDADAATTRAGELCANTGAAHGSAECDALLEGYLDIANQRMAEAIRKISVRKGDDPATFALVAFGGAGPQHACDIAALLGIETVHIPHDASLLSAAGLGAAKLEAIVTKQTLLQLATSADEDALAQALSHVEHEAQTRLAEEASSQIELPALERLIRMRYSGQEHALQVRVESASEARDSFLRQYEMVFGSVPVGRNVEVESISVIATQDATVGDSSCRNEIGRISRACAGARRQPLMQKMRLRGEWAQAPVIDWESVEQGASIDGPALISQQRTCVVVPPDWSASVDAHGACTLRGRKRAQKAAGVPHTSGVVQRELIINKLVSVAEEMGETLGRTAVSVNVKERLDFSCALLNEDATLVASAPHIPVHLGALGFCARAVHDVLTPQPGDVFLTNHPGYGGSHLPDMTVVAPVFDDADNALIGWSASRAHHAEVGGVKPGSMSPVARSLEEEGVIIAPMRLFDRGQARWDVLETLLYSGPFPTRAPEDNLADIRAAVAAARQASASLRQVCREVGADYMSQAMRMLLARTEVKTRGAICALGFDERIAEDALDDGAPIHVRVAPRRNGSIIIDFTGSAAQRADPFNAPLAVVRSAVAYVMRLLLGEPTPLNEGLLAPVELQVPAGSMLNPCFDARASHCPSVAGGNVETSQRVVDVLLQAFGLAANSQGTMNNIAFGGKGFSVYETLGGGAGATPDCNGASGVHVHMSNTAITDVEALEIRAPVRIEQFALRPDSGGRGTHRGGDGLIRHYRFLSRASVSLLTQRRTSPARGMSGGGSGLCGEQRALRIGGVTETLGAVAAIDMDAGDCLIVTTPGGGAYGPASK